MKEIRDIVAAFARAQEHKMAAALATVISVEGSSYRQAGARMLITEDGCMTGAISGGCLEGDALRKAKLVMDRGQAKLVRYDTNDEDDAQMGLGLGCKGIIDVLIEPLDAAAAGNPIRLLAQTCGHREPQLIVTHASRNPGRPSLGTCLLLGSAMSNPRMDERFGMRARSVLAGGGSALDVSVDEVCFYEILEPELRLLICGAGNDAIPLMQLAAVLGWETHVTDGRPAYLSAARFPLATALHLLTVNQAELPLVADQRMVAVLMSHNYNYDIAMLRRLLPANLPYIGALGPKRKLLRMLEELGIDAEATPECLHGPTGLDIGASTPEEIALSIVAEIQSVVSRRAGEPLRERLQPIHQL